MLVGLHVNQWLNRWYRLGFAIAIFGRVSDGQAPAAPVDSLWNHRPADQVGSGLNDAGNRWTDQKSLSRPPSSRGSAADFPSPTSVSMPESDHVQEYDLWISAIVSAGFLAGLGMLYGSISSMTSGGGDTKPQKDVQNRSPVLLGPKDFVVSEANTGSIGFVQAKDADDDSITFSLSGADKEYFQIGSISGEISLLDGVTLDYDHPQDFDANNIFSLVVTALDSRGRSTSGSVSVTLENADDEAPTISGLKSRYQVDEGVTDSLAELIAYDADGGSADVVWQLGGSDASLFSLSSKGVLAVESVLDFEVPSDQNGDGAYEFTVQASDSAGNLSTLHEVQIQVNDVWEATVDQTISFSQILEKLNEDMSVIVVEQIDYAALFLDRDFDGDGEVDALVIFADHHLESAPPGLIVALFEEPQPATNEQPIWLSSSHNQAYAGLAHATSWVVPDVNHNKVVLNSSSYEIEIMIEPHNLFPGKFHTKIKHPPTQHNRQFLANDDGREKWSIETNGTQKNDVLISTDLKLDSNQLYAIGDVTKNGSAEILVYDRSKDQVDVWVWAAENGSISQMENSSNPYHRGSLLKNKGLVNDLTEIVHFDVVEGNGNVSAPPALLFCTTDTAWVLS